MKYSIASIAAAALFASAGVAVSTEMPRTYDKAATAEYCKQYAPPHADGRARGVLYSNIYDGAGNIVGKRPIYSVVRQGGKIIGYNPACGGHG